MKESELSSSFFSERSIEEKAVSEFIRTRQPLDLLFS
jgi:hypothetical protein